MRLLIVPRCETTLSWDQLRSPQVSQFLVKPIQQQIRTSHFSKATLYALMANCLQFSKEAEINPGNSGVSKTRALVCELLAMKLLREFSTRDLIDALSYDFYPLQGVAPASSGNPVPGLTVNGSPPQSRSAQQPRAARISTLEIAIRAQSKRLLAHPLVVQQLEAIWAGTIVFHSAADNLHRPPIKITPHQSQGYGAIAPRGTNGRAALDQLHPAKQRQHLEPTAFAVRRSATLYDPRDASLFKLSRLRVPRYRQFLSTCSFAVLLGLYLAVLIERSLIITPLEIVFWFWSAGFMLDEIVGFNEQGFSLYLMSFWNTFDVGILLLLVFYYGMRLYGVLLPDVPKHAVADVAYDILAANAVLLFPRLFSVLDHYRYFSQLLIAFRMMALDLVAVFVLIIISCSGFFVAFTLSFGGSDDYNGGAVAYALFQMLMGFTPAAWEVWPTYNVLGKIILTLFLFICHFLIVTILITVLTNSFMAIVQNANEEHQFVFAVNAISMVKSDALFSYVAPTNVIAWLLAPLRYILPFRQFVRINRTVIKVTHFPVLFLIYSYERLILRGTMFDLAETVEQRGRLSHGIRAFEAPGVGLKIFSPNQGRLREHSVATYHKDRALEEVFRRPFRDDTIRNTQKSTERRKTSNVVNGWMQNMGPNGTASPPPEQDRSVIDRLEARRLAHRRSQLISRRRQGGHGRAFTDATMSVVSDPEEFGTIGRGRPPMLRRREDTEDTQDTSLLEPSMALDETPQTDAGDGDDELATHDEHEEDLVLSDRPAATPLDKPQQQQDYFQQTPTSKPKVPHFSSSYTPPHTRTPPKQVTAIKTGPHRPGRNHSRNVSTTTILYDPPAYQSSSSSTSSPNRKAITARNSARNTGGAVTPISTGRRTPKRTLESGVTAATARPRPILPPRSAFQSAPNLAGMMFFDNTNTNNPNDPHRTPRRGGGNSLTMDLGSDLGDNKAVGGGFIGAVPSSFQTQMAFATGAMRARKAAESGNEDQQRMGKLVLARMNTLEEGFREVLREVKDLTRGGGGGGGGGARNKTRRQERERSSRERRKKESEKEKERLKGKGKGKEKADENERENAEWKDDEEGQEHQQQDAEVEGEENTGKGEPNLF